ncbi:MAG TPA: lysylphosphatidylglycerol synthase domain-containing protein [Thermoanaerobaculia bacterium]|nr:lysylphosphatidylglycerol synthase domain-containing protein [Thermoanaerobaculia bacterium]
MSEARGGAFSRAWGSERAGQQLAQQCSVSTAMSRAGCCSRWAPGWRGAVLCGAALLGLALVALALARPQLVARSAGRLASALPDHWRGRAAAAGGNFLRGLHVVRAPFPLAIAILASTAMWLTHVAAYVVLGHGLGLALPVGAYFLLKGIGQLAFAFPATAAGLGIFDYVVLATGKTLGLGPEQAGAFAVAAHALDVIPITVVGLFFAWRALPALTDGRPLLRLRRRAGRAPVARPAEPAASATTRPGPRLRRTDQHEQS